jgi:hypothetical protein
MRLAIGTVVHFAPPALFYYSKPRDDLWPIGSFILAGIYVPYLPWATTRQDGRQK